MNKCGGYIVTVHYILVLRCYFSVTASLGIEHSQLLFLCILIDRNALVCWKLLSIDCRWPDSFHIVIG